MQIEGVGAIVTGGSSGLGAAVVKLLGRRGARVAILDINEPAISLPVVDFVRTDVSHSEEVAAGIGKIVGLQGVPRIVVNCAGVGEFIPVVGADGPPDLAHFDRTLAINLRGSYDVIRQTAYLMAREDPIGEERGVIVNTTSIAGFDGLEGQAAYSASKGALISMTLPLARDLAPHRIRINSIAPGVFRTGLSAGLSQAIEDDLARQTPSPSRMGDPSEFAALVVHIVENPMLNGETIRLDAGLRMGFSHRSSPADGIKASTHP